MPQTSDLTPAQARVLAVIQHRLESGEPPPTYRELQQELKFHSTATVRDHLRTLEHKGFLRRSAGGARNVRLVDAPPKTRVVPILGRVVAGEPVTAEQELLGRFSIPAEWIGDGCFALFVNGDSMEGAAILNGDVAIIDPKLPARSGSIVCATVNGETTLKYLERRQDRQWLVPANPRYRAIPVGEDSQVHGVLTVLLRRVRSASKSITTSAVLDPDSLSGRKARRR